MRIMISGDVCDEEAIAEPFEIEGSGEKFAVHRAIEGDLAAGKAPWTATHLETGFAVGRGDSIDEAIEHARAVWSAKTPEQIEQAKSFARLQKEKRNSGLFGA